jgi:transcriptional regulator with XRE-family HTH domain
VKGREHQLDAIRLALGEVVRRRRLARGLSQEELAHASGLHRTYVSDLERGRKSASVRALTSLGIALKVAPSTLLREAEDIARP